MDELHYKLDLLLAQTELKVDQNQRNQLIIYVNLLNKWNKTYNLTSVRDPIEMLVKHILDSIMISSYLEGQRFIDVGTGPGLPGIPLAIMNPDKEFVLLDSLGKRIRFIKQSLYELGLKNVTPVQSRVDEYKPELKFDTVLSRAFSSMSNMVEWCSHLLNDKKESGFFALKGILHQEEIEQLPDWCIVSSIKKINIPEFKAERHLVILSRNL